MFQISYTTTLKKTPSKNGDLQKTDPVPETTKKLYQENGKESKVDVSAVMETPILMNLKQNV